MRTGGGLIKSKNLDFKTHYTHKEQKLQTLLTESAIEFEIQTIVCIEIEREGERLVQCLRGSLRSQSECP